MLSGSKFGFHYYLCFCFLIYFFIISLWHQQRIKQIQWKEIISTKCWGEKVIESIEKRLASWSYAMLLNDSHSVSVKMGEKIYKKPESNRQRECVCVWERAESPFSMVEQCGWMPHNQAYACIYATAKRTNTSTTCELKGWFFGRWRDNNG